jgi:signal recognition particle GTPase
MGSDRWQHLIPYNQPLLKIYRVIIDTAGRLHNKINLMNELTKVKRVMQKLL